MLETTGCDAIMIGRGVLGNPWLIKNTIDYLNGNEFCNVSIEDKIDMCLKHLNYLKELKDDKLATLEIRNHISWYFKGVPGANTLKNSVFKCKTVSEINDLLKEYKENING